jgi:hypothetical protein
MCDCSLHNVTTRPAKVGDKLVTQQFVGSFTRGFAAPDDLNVAVCVLPGTELSFSANVSRERPWPWSRNVMKHTTAILSTDQSSEPQHPSRRFGIPGWTDRVAYFTDARAAGDNPSATRECSWAKGSPTARASNENEPIKKYPDLPLIGASVSDHSPSHYILGPTDEGRLGRQCRSHLGSRSWVCVVLQSNEAVVRVWNMGQAILGSRTARQTHYLLPLRRVGGRHANSLI